MRISWTRAAAADLEPISNYLKAPSPLPPADHAQGVRGYPFPERVAPTRTSWTRGRNPRAVVSSHSLHRGVPGARTEHRSLADLPHRTGSALAPVSPTKY